MTTEAEKAASLSSSQDKLSEEDAKTLARKKRIDELLYDIFWLDVRKDALEEIREGRTNELKALMAAQGVSQSKNDYAGATAGDKREFTNHSPAALLKLFPNKTIEETALYFAQKFKPTADWFDGAKAAGLAVETAVSCETKDRFEVRRPATKDKKEWIANMVEANRQETEAAIKAEKDAMLSGSMKGAK